MAILMDKALLQQLVKPVLLLGAFALFGVIILSIIHKLTLPTIKQNERQALINQLNNVLIPDSFDNDLLNNTRTLDGDAFHSEYPVTAYLATKHDSPVAAVFATSTPDGYSGTIKMVVGVSLIDQKITGVRVIAHKETPGLGDKIEHNRNDWILGFTGKSLQNPESKYWKVKKDGGEFDQFTGATITPRAVVHAARDVLIWTSQDQHIKQLLASPDRIMDTPQ